MIWVAPYIGVPFEVANCWELARRVLRDQRGIELPDYAGLYDPARALEDLSAARVVEELIVQERATAAWKRVEVPEPFDVILLRMLGHVSHCAVVVDRRTALSSRPRVGGHLFSYGLGRYAHRIEGFYRYVGPSES